MTKLNGGTMIAGVIAIALIIAAILFINDNGDLPVGPNINQADINNIDVLEAGTAVALNVEHLNFTGGATVTVGGDGAAINIVGGGGGASIEGQNDLTPVVPTISAINAGTGLEGVDSGSGVLTLNVITPTPQPTSTPSAGGGGSAMIAGMALPNDATPTSSDFSGLPGSQMQTTGSGSNIANDVYYFPFIVYEDITVNRASMEYVSGNGSTDCRLGIWEADEFWQPTTLTSDLGTLDIGSGGAGWYHLTGLSVALTPGSYLVGELCESVNRGSFGYVNDHARPCENTTAFQACINSYRVSVPSNTPSTAYPGTPDTWNEYELDNGFMFATVLLRWAVD